ncbi:ADP-forming succinate--CoA ligase subunit beta [candidate division TA06 bacterium]|uniref:Succinate--CoA ligase [ADP-forming] subunit beta n=1 Tax=candidate division TA06 bacterium TaxID=2250710 RepID=A0A523UQ07_UNCT6|nr:MAG: ADP-forming succinate--CoA ligase subunit beta [candidate division TA06 bacterium]
MKIHEYQAKEIFSKFGVPVPPGDVAETPEQAYSIAKRIADKLVVKAQVLVGGRGKAGGVKLADSPEKAKEIASEILGMDIKGLRVEKVLVAQAVDIKEEYYLGIILDRRSQKPVVMASAAGGVDIEEVARNTPEKIFKMTIEDVQIGLMPHQARWLCLKIFKSKSQALKASRILMSLYRAFMSSDASLAEINPLVVTTSGDVLAIDAKMNVDDNGLYRHKEIEEMRDLKAEDPREAEAREKDLSYIKLDGSIGCVVNGAGLAMATMDLVKKYGGEPANFLDIGGSSSPEKVENAVRILMTDENVKAVYFNIFGGITRCDDVANGILVALDKMDIDVPIIIRLTGTNENEGRKILEKTDLIPAASMAEGAKKAIELAGKAG